MKPFGILLLALLALAAVSGVASAAVVRGEGHYTYFGLAADTKPVSAQAGDRFIETDSQGREYVYNGSAWVRAPQAVTNDNAAAGERNISSSTGTDYVNAAPETKCDTVDVATNSTTVYNGPARLYLVWVNTATSADTGNAFKDNATSKFTVGASLAIGTNYPFPGSRFDTSLVFDPNDAATGNITVCYAPLDAGVTY